jgi:DnaK suppressor protein
MFATTTGLGSIERTAHQRGNQVQEDEEGAMTKTELDRFRGILTAKVAELERFTRQRDGIVVDRCADQLEEIQAASQRALAVGNLDREFTQLRAARAALRRIEDGSFGTCQECDEDIHPKRLAAVPWATFCIRCQEAVDRNFEEIQAPSRDFLDRAA